MIAYRNEKIENAICFFAKMHRKVTRKPLNQTFLYKYLAFLDFRSVEETGKPAFGLEYKAMERGPVPIEIYSKRGNYRTHLFEFKRISENQYVIIPKGEPDLDYFSRFEIDEMNRLIEIYADVFVKTGDISEASHQAIRAWRKAWETRPNSIIKYELTFAGDIGHMDGTQLSFSEEGYLTYKAMEETSR